LPPLIALDASGTPPDDNDSSGNSGPILTADASAPMDAGGASLARLIDKTPSPDPRPARPHASSSPAEAAPSQPPTSAPPPAADADAGGKTAYSVFSFPGPASQPSAPATGSGSSGPRSPSQRGP